MKNVNEKLKLKQKEKIEKGKFSFESKFKFKTLHINLSHKKEKKQKHQEDLKTDKFNFEIENTSNLKDKILTLDSKTVKDHYKLKNLENCKIYLKSNLKTLYLDNLKNCQIFSGIVETSIFGENLVDSEIKCIAQQIRIHKTHKCTFFNFVSSNMIIEDCNKLKVFELKVGEEEKEIFEMFGKSGLSLKKNNWEDIKDFNWIKNTKSPNYDICR